MSTPSDPQWSSNDPNLPLSGSSDPVPPAAQPYAYQPFPPAPQPRMDAGPPGYPPYSPYYGPPQRTNGFAIASMVLGILWIYWIGSILALIFGYIARNQIRERREGGDGMAIAGIVLGWIGVGVLAVVLFFVVLAIARNH